MAAKYINTLVPCHPPSSLPLVTCAEKQATNQRRHHRITPLFCRINDMWCRHRARPPRARQQLAHAMYMQNRQGYTVSNHLWTIAHTLEIHVLTGGNRICHVRINSPDANCHTSFGFEFVIHIFSAPILCRTRENRHLDLCNEQIWAYGSRSGTSPRLKFLIVI
jgi:hypothetical protein